MLKRTRPNAKVVIVTGLLLLMVLAARSRYNKPARPRWTIADRNAFTSNGSNETSNSYLLPCERLPGAEDVVVVMRTGATEIQDKLPAHLNTTFRCYQDLVIFSDYEEAFQGFPVRDVLASMNQELIYTNEDFELYLRLRQYGRASLRVDELSGQASSEGSKGGKAGNPGWRLDKWKFLPMLNETLKLRPDKKWYVFVESDSYPVYSNILQFVERLDPSRPLYLGSEVEIGGDIFAHGGSVFVMSKPAIEIGAKYYAEQEQELNKWTAGHWAGDCVLGKMLNDAGVPLSWMYPMFQGGHPEKMDFTEQKFERKLWCSPALSYHHFSPGELEGMWQFEQAWIRSRLDKTGDERQWKFWNDYGDILEHRDVFRNLVLPKIHEGKFGRRNWDNLSPILVENTTGNSFEDCQKLCASQTGCLQFASSRNGCAISTREVMLGEPENETKSGWCFDRIERWMNVLDNCAGREGWIEV